MSPNDSGSSPIVRLLDEREGFGRASRPLLIAEHGRLSYAQLLDRVPRLAGLFARLGLSVADRIVIVTRDDVALASIFIAALRCGITSALLNPEARPAELSSLIGAADPGAVFVDDKIPLPDDIATRIPVIRVTKDSGSVRGTALKVLLRGRRSQASDALEYPALLETVGPAAELPAEIPAHVTAYILFTSGTTSRPKGVEISHRALFAQMDTFVRQYDLDTDTRLFNLLPFHHTDGLTHGLIVMLRAGGTLVRPMRIRVNRIPEMLEAIYSQRVTHVITVPSVLALMMGLGDQYANVFRAAQFRFVISTAAYLDERLWTAFEERYRVQVVNVYGLTETVCESLYCGPDEATRRIGTVGKPVDCEVRIVDGDWNDVPEGETGELLLRGDHIMTGYFRMPEETARVLRDGWFATGDLAARDADQFIRIVGRKKDVIITAGINVYPEDVTGVLRSMPQVVDAATFGEPDPMWGERVVACIIPMPGIQLSDATVTDYFLSRAAPDKLPREVHFFTEFPRGPAGKVIMADLRKQVAERRAETLLATDGAASVAGRVLEVAAHSFKCNVDALSLTSTPDTVAAWTSLAHVAFLLGLEESFGITLSPRDIMRIKCLGDAVRLLEERANAEQARGVPSVSAR